MQIETKINDPLIRTLLKRQLIARGLEDSQIVEELAIDRGKVIADLIGLFKIPHCYEIKSEVDSLKRLKGQSRFYGKSFPKVTLVTVEKHLMKAIDMIPEWWGVQVAIRTNDRLRLKNYRSTSFNPEFLKEEHLKLLWNEQLKHELSFREVVYRTNFNREELAKLLSKSLNRPELFQVSKKYLSKRLIDKAQMLSM